MIFSFLAEFLARHLPLHLIVHINRCLVLNHPAQFGIQGFSILFHVHPCHRKLIRFKISICTFYLKFEWQGACTLCIRFLLLQVYTFLELVRGYLEDFADCRDAPSEYVP